MTFVAICHLRKPLPPPSQRWLTKFIKDELHAFHFITTKPIAQQCARAQDETTIQDWFKRYHEFVLQHHINPESIWNMDETGFRIGIPGGERVIIPREAKELYTPSPENRMSITILETVSAVGKVIPPVLVVPAKIHMDSWYHNNLQGIELILLSDSRFSNSQLALRWLEHFVEHTAPYENMKVLLLDSHVSHTSYDFIIAAQKYNIIIYVFPSHLTHVLQPLDVGIFQPYKHWHKEAVLKAIRSMDITYDLPSFMKDLTQIREQTFKESTIISAFQKAGIWPISCDIAITKLQTYSKPRPRPRPITPPTTLLLRLLTPKPSSFRDSEQGLQRWKSKLTGLLSSPSQKSYDNWACGTEEVLVSGQLQQLDLQVLQQQVEEQKRGRGKSRARLQVGGELNANQAHKLRAAKAELQAQKAQAKEARVAQQATNQARRQLRGVGVEARRQERLRKKRVKAHIRAGNPIPPEDEDPIPDPEAGSEPGSEPEPSSEPRFEPGFEPEPEPGFEPRFELELEPGFEFELDPGSQLARELQSRLE